VGAGAEDENEAETPGSLPASTAGAPITSLLSQLPPYRFPHRRAAEIMADHAGLTFECLDGRTYDWLDAALTAQTTPEEVSARVLARSGRDGT
jgi:hypothetical protein